MIGRKLPEILMFHHVEPKPLEPPARHPASYLSPEQFARVLDQLVERGYRGLSLAQALELQQRRLLPARAVILTFDDGCRCFADFAAPALAARGFSATLYVVSGALGATNHWDRQDGERREDLLDATALRRLAEAGFEIGCHGRNHRDLTALDAAGVTVLGAETAGAKAELELALGRPVSTFCYPYGCCDGAARQAVASAGFAAAVGIVDHGVAARGDLWALPRWPLGPAESHFEVGLKVTGWYRLWRRLPRLGLLSLLRRWSGGNR